MTPTSLRAPVAPGVSAVPVRSPTLPPATHTNAYVIGQQDVVVVDPASPWPDQQAHLCAALDGLRVRAIFLTHHHLDHVSGTVALAAETGAPVWAHAATAERVRFPVDRIIEPGEMLTIDGTPWEALHTPGHATGHLCLWQAQARTVVAGDMVAGVGTIVLDPPEGHLGDYLVSLRGLRELDARVLLPAHGQPQTDARGLLTTYIDHRLMRTEQYVDVLRRRGPLTPQDIVPDVYTELPATYHPLAARQVLCHLQWLVETGRLNTRGDQFVLEA